MKKKGSALILTLCIIMLLTTLTLVLVAEASSSYTLTAREEKKDQTYLMAESGIEKGLIGCKQVIYDNPELLTSSKSKETSIPSAGFSFVDNNIKTSVSFFDSTHDSKSCIKIKSISENASKSETKMLTAYIYKTDISDKYCDIFTGNVFTTLDNVDGNNSTSFYVSDNTPFHLHGSMYLQGGDISIIPRDSWSTYDNNISININANKLELLKYRDTAIFGYDYPANQALKKSIIPNSKIIVNSYFDELVPKPLISDDAELKKSLLGNSPDHKDPETLSMLGVVNRSSDITYDSSYDSKYNQNYNLKIKSDDIIDSHGVAHKVAIFKVTKKSSNAPTLNWSGLAVEAKYYIMTKMLGYVDTSKKFDIFDIAQAIKLIYPNDKENQFDNVYKVFIIDGDVDVDAGIINKFEKQIIYSTGKVTIGGDLGAVFNSVNFSNSSLVAKKIEIDDLGLDLNGAGMNISALTPEFNEVYKATLNKYFLEHLSSDYASKLIFKYKLEEN